MATRQSLRILVGMCAISAWHAWLGLPARAESLNYKSYVWMNQGGHRVVDDVEGHTVSLARAEVSCRWTTGSRDDQASDASMIRPETRAHLRSMKP